MKSLPVGMAISPRMKSFIDRQQIDTGCLPMLVDPRLSFAASQVFFDRADWLKRCKEQRRWDAERFDFQPKNPTPP